MLEKTLESPLNSKQIKPVNPKGNQFWIFFGRTDAEAEVPILWPPNVKNWLIGKDPDAGKDRRWEEKETAEDEMVGWHHWFNGPEIEHALGVGDGQGGLVCYSPWGHKESDMTERLNWTEPTPVFLHGRIPWTEEPGSLQSMRSQRVRQDWLTKHTYTMKIGGCFKQVGLPN